MMRGALNRENVRSTMIGKISFCSRGFFSLCCRILDAQRCGVFLLHCVVPGG
jgi:hypothetical protein